MHKLIIVAILIFFFSNVDSAFSNEINLKPTKISEGNYTILLFEPKRSEFIIPDNYRNVTVTTYNYNSYFQRLDILYESSCTDWYPSREIQRKYDGNTNYFDTLMIESSTGNVQKMLSERLGVKAEILSKREIKYGKYIGIECVLGLTISNIPYTYIYRTYMIGSKQYVLSVLYPQKYDRIADPYSFLNSFNLN